MDNGYHAYLITDLGACTVWTFTGSQDLTMTCQAGGWTGAVLNSAVGGPPNNLLEADWSCSSATEPCPLPPYDAYSYAIPSGCPCLTYGQCRSVCCSPEADPSTGNCWIDDPSTPGTCR